MRLKYSFYGILSLCAFIACNTQPKEGGAENKYDSASIGLMSKDYRDQDSTIMAAYLQDKSTISTFDIDIKDTSFSSRSKFLYKSGNSDRQLAVVYGFKKNNSMGVAIVEIVGEKPIHLKETKRRASVLDADYSDGKNTLQRSGEFAIWNNEQFVEIK